MEFPKRALNNAGPRRFVLAATSLACFWASGTAPAAGSQVPPNSNRFSDSAQVTAVEMVVEVLDADGRAATGLRPEDFRVTEDGDPTEVIGVEAFRSGEPPGAAGTVDSDRQIGRGQQGAWDWRLVIWFDQELSSSRSIRRAAEALAAQAGALTALGTVEIVTAGSDRRFLLPRTRSAPLVEEKLLALARETPGRDRIRAIRKEFLDRTQLFSTLEGRDQPGNMRLNPMDQRGGGASGGEVAGSQNSNLQRRDGAQFSRKSMIQESASAERMIIDRRLDLLVSFLTLNAEPAPKALILVSDGWDIDPREFYLTGMPSDTASFGFELTALLDTTRSGSAFDGLAKHLATSGWTSFSIASGAMEAASGISSDISGHGRAGAIVSGGPETVTAIPSRLLVRPNEPLYALAEATGGEALTGVNAIPRSLGRLADRVRITYQVARPPDSRQRKVEVQALRSGLEVRAPIWAGIPAAEAVASARARNLLAGDPVRGDLPFEAAIGLQSSATSGSDRRRGELQARIDLSTLRQVLLRAASSDLRFTLAMDVPGGGPFVHQTVVPAQALAGLTSWTYSMPIDLPRDFGKVAVVLEEMTTGAWGAGLAAIVEGTLPPARRALRRENEGDEMVSAETSDPDAILDLLPGRKPVLLSAPELEPAIGRVRFEPLVAAEAVEKVDFLLDGTQVASSHRRPFEVTVDLGPLPIPRRLEAVARDANGQELGRDTLDLNGGIGVFAIRLIEPRGSIGAGVVDVEAEVTLPSADDDPIDRVELFWNDDRVATMFAPPFRQRLAIPPDAPTGFISAVAIRRGGTSVEDVRLMNGGEGGAEAIDVQLVELAAAVLDAEGRPVRGLGRDRFRLSESGIDQSLDAVRDGRELPLTLGMAIDSSASLFEEMTEVKRAAIDFIGLTLDPTDRAFVVDFDTEPRLAVELTGDQRRLNEGIAALRPGGSTALCDALVYSLARLQRVRGRRALVLLSDGLGRDERVSFAACQRFVARSGVPVYLLLLPEEGPADPVRAEAAAKRIESLVAPSGGRAIRVRDLSELGSVYRDVQAELRGQYVLSYYPTGRESGATGGWREVRVSLEPPGLTVRTATGYYR